MCSFTKPLYTSFQRRGSLQPIMPRETTTTTRYAPQVSLTYCPIHKYLVNICSTWSSKQPAQVLVRDNGNSLQYLINNRTGPLYGTAVFGTFLMIHYQFLMLPERWKKWALRKQTVQDNSYGRAVYTTPVPAPKRKRGVVAITTF